jgi:hypothetical protein
MQKVNVQQKFTNKLLLFMNWQNVTNWCCEFSKGELMFTMNKGVVGHLWSLMNFRKLKEKFAQIGELHYVRLRSLYLYFRDTL